MQHIPRLSRRTLVGGGTAAAALSLAGCGGAPGAGGGNLSQPEGDVPPEYEGRTRIVFWAAYPEQLSEPFNKLVGGFNDAQDGIYADIQFQPNYRDLVQQLIRGLQSKQVPDVALFDVPLWQRFVTDNVLEPLDDYLAKEGMARTDYVDAFINEGIKNDQLWWIPFNRSTPLFYYNKDAYRSAGVSEAGPVTWSELREFGPALQQTTINDRHPKALALLPTAHNWIFSGMAHAWDGAISEGLDITIDQGGALEAADWMRKLIFEDELAYQVNDTTVDFINGVTASIVQTTGQLTKITNTAKFEVGVAFVPKEKSPGTPTGGAGLSILAGIPQERKDAAFAFLKHVGQAEVAASWSVDTGYLPVVKKSLETPALKDFIASNPHFGVATEQLEVAQSMDDILTQVPGTQEVVNTGLETLFGENPDTKTALSGVAEELTKLAEPYRNGG